MAKFVELIERSIGRGGVDLAVVVVLVVKDDESGETVRQIKSQSRKNSQRDNKRRNGTKS